MKNICVYEGNDRWHIQANKTYADKFVDDPKQYRKMEQKAALFSSAGWAMPTLLFPDFCTLTDDRKRRVSSACSISVCPDLSPR